MLSATILISSIPSTAKAASASGDMLKLLDSVINVQVKDENGNMKLTRTYYEKFGLTSQPRGINELHDAMSQSFTVIFVL